MFCKIWIIGYKNESKMSKNIHSFSCQKHFKTVSLVFRHFRLIFGQKLIQNILEVIFALKEFTRKKFSSKFQFSEKVMMVPPSMHDLSYILRYMTYIYLAFKFCPFLNQKWLKNTTFLKIELLASFAPQKKAEIH